jgi:hypothetical protein
MLIVVWFLGAIVAVVAQSSSCGTNLNALSPCPAVVTDSGECANPGILCQWACCVQECTESLSSPSNDKIRRTISFSCAQALGEPVRFPRLQLEMLLTTFPLVATSL